MRKIIVTLQNSLIDSLLGKEEAMWEHMHSTLNPIPPPK